MAKCNIIPKKILKKIAENDPDDRRRAFYADIVANQENKFRKKRKQIQDNLLNGGIVPDVDKAHTEHLLVYDNKAQWDFSTQHLWEEYIEKHPPEMMKKTKGRLPGKKAPRRTFTKDMDKIYDMFHDLLNRESFDNENATCNIFLKFGVNYPNAFWDGEYLAFGKGDGYYFRDFSKVFDIIAHEFGHAITQYESNLQYEMQAGALNESISDVFGICAYQRKYNLSVDKTNWMLSPNVFFKRVNAQGLRSFTEEPAYDDPVIGKDEQPKFMSEYVDLPNDEENDWGGVHTNSGIPNHAFYKFNMKLGGKSWANGSLDIWYHSMLKQNGLSAHATFKDFANKTLEVVPKIGKPWSIDIVTKLEDAWKEVGIL